MMLNIDTIANEIATSLADFKAQVMYSAEFELRELEQQLCVVVPISSVPQNITRKHSLVTHTVEVGLLYRSKTINIASMIKQLKNIANRCNGKKVQTATCVQTEFDPLYDQDQLRQRNQFTGVVVLTFKEVVKC
jgi:hypothetical protein